MKKKPAPAAEKCLNANLEILQNASALGLH